ncbi:MAG: hypothetical protein HY791_06445 [Deltaproteobacteria bacterium]|nr:hypothetical protein [Deltaproteobacteria bacterium]
MSIQKPAFPNPSTALTKATLDKLEGLVKEVRGADGGVDVQALSAKVATSSDEGLKSGFAAIKDAFTRSETVTYTSGCGGSTTRRTEPKSLSANEVMSVLSALVDARQKVDGLDSNHDGKLQGPEADKASELSGLSGGLAKGAVEAQLKSYRSELSKWRDALGQVASSVDDRKRINSDIASLAKHHAATPEGEQAILWAYRDVATLGQGLDVWKLREALENAETSFLKYIPFFGRHAKTAEGHLSNSEVRSLLGCEDLGAFAATKKASTEARIHMSYDEYLSGKDLPGSTQLTDPDFKRSSYRAGC